jgi:hypothetical protein
LPSPIRMCVDRMCKLRGLPWIVIVLFVCMLAVRFLAPAEAQEAPYLGGAACAQYGGCGGAGGIDPGPPLLASASASASAPASPPPSYVTPGIVEDAGDRPGHGQLVSKDDEQSVGRDAEQGARDATGALGRAGEGEHQGREYRADAESGWLRPAQRFVRPGLWSAREEDVATAGMQVVSRDPAEVTPVTDITMEGGGEPMKAAAETSDDSAEIDLAMADNGETQHVREVASVKWVDSDFMESGVEGAGGEGGAEPDDDDVENAEAGFSGDTTRDSAAQELKADSGPPDLSVAELGPVGEITECRHGGATLVAGAGALLVVTVLGILAMVVRRTRAG